jgi:hypothetical protein
MYDRCADAILRRPPSNVDLWDFPTEPSLPPPAPRPLHDPTSATFLILRKGFAKIIGRIVHHFQKLDTPAQYADVEGLQAEIDAFVDDLPVHYRMHGPDRSLDERKSGSARGIVLRPAQNTLGCPCIDSYS